MPKDAINLEELLLKIQKGEIKMDMPLIKYQGTGTEEFFVFQDSGLNLLLGHEGNGKTKFLTIITIQLLDYFQEKDSRFEKFKILYIDTERPESQYAKTLEHIIHSTKLEESEVFNRLNFLSVMDLDAKSIVESINKHLLAFSEYKFIVIIDHVLPLVNDLNSTSEAAEIDHFIKLMIYLGHIIVASIHKPYSGITKGLGHVGSALQRLASFILEISNDMEGKGFEIKQFKSRISAKSNYTLFMQLDENGNIDLAEVPILTQTSPRKTKVDETLIVKEIIEEYESQAVHTKKQLLSIISKKKGYSDSSSSASTYFKNHFKDQISFESE